MSVQDQMTVQFSANGQSPFSVTNWTSYNISRDFFTPADAFTLTLEGEPGTQLMKALRAGMQADFMLPAGSATLVVLRGYIDNFRLVYDRNSGTRLTITGRDALGQASDATCLPNMGQSSATNFHFNANTTFQQALQTIFAPFGITNIVADDGDLTFASGFNMGLRQKGKGRGLSGSLTNSLKHLLQPFASESYLQYALRIARCVGCNLKMKPGTADTLFALPPTYYRSNLSPFQLIHSIIDPSQNNVLDGNMDVNYREQPSVIIGEITHGDPSYRKQTFKVICVNELTGYQVVNGRQTATQLASVSSVVESLTTYNNYSQLDYNASLAGVSQNLPINPITAFNRPLYYADYNAHSLSELQFAVAKKMAEYQDKFLQLDYTVVGHTINGALGTALWTPNVMVNVQDETLQLFDNFWLGRVNYTKTRQQGTRTSLGLSLPFTHNFS